MIPIYENYQGYQPPRYVYLTVAKLLSKLPTHYLSGLQSVVLTNAGAIRGGKTHRIKGKKYTLQSCFGFYHAKSNREGAWVEIVVDNIVARYCAKGVLRALSYVALYREIAFAEVLYHEVGHHLDRTIGALARGSESNAEAWKNRLARTYIRDRCWYLLPFGRMVSVVGRALRKVRWQRSAR
jgi:hypothetical protein